MTAKSYRYSRFIGRNIPLVLWLQLVIYSVVLLGSLFQGLTYKMFTGSHVSVFTLLFRRILFFFCISYSRITTFSTSFKELCTSIIYLFLEMLIFVAFTFVQMLLEKEKKLKYYFSKE